MIKVLFLCLFLTLLGIAWELSPDAVDCFNLLGDGMTMGSTNFLLRQAEKEKIKKAGEEGLDAFLTAGLSTQALKLITHCKRPNGESYDSFPSGHTAMAFASAKVFSHYYPENKVLYYIIAIGVAVARVQSGAHYTRDVIGGALVGLWSGELALEGKGVLTILKKKF
ncbi:phosphatase PAP2 family protein [bacterium]|nr:phosphatase PAP2 family protein [bacterium]